MLCYISIWAGCSYIGTETVSSVIGSEVRTETNRYGQRQTDIDGQRREELMQTETDRDRQ